MTPADPGGKRRFPPSVTLALGVASLAALAAGFSLFRFRTDDAYIAFRYVDQSMRGYGFVWNPAPFRPVEGYTSFLWIALLRVVWTLFGLEPPAAADALALLFAGLQLLLVARLAADRLADASGPSRTAWLSLVLAMILTNRTFLAWTSSGLETSLFNLLVTGWVYLSLDRTIGSERRRALLGANVALLCLARPDGYLFLAVTLLREGAIEWRERSGRRLARFLPWLAPVVVHLLWRRSFYGEWLPNTYFAKVDDPWYESGFRYLGCFLIEYGYWLVPLALLAAFVRHPRRVRMMRDAADGLASDGFRRGATLAALALQIAYYARIGGDHFEYRVLSHLVPLATVGTVWLFRRILPGRLAPAAALLVFLVGLPIPWTHWHLSRTLTTREETHRMFVPVAPAFPRALSFLVRPFDAWQEWLISRSVCLRHQEHKIFLEDQVRAYGAARRPYDPAATARRAMALYYVGYPSWVFPDACIFDRLGLNDAVVARHEARGKNRHMAHDRIPPEGYLTDFRIPAGAPEYLPVAYPLPPLEEIPRIEAAWRSAIEARARRLSLLPSSIPRNDLGPEPFRRNAP